MVGKRVGQSLYQLDLLTQEKVNAKAAISSGASFNVWHERLAHVNHDTIRKMITSNSVVGLNIIGELSAAPCDPCIIGKMHRMPFPKGRERAEEVGGIIHSDVVEMNVPSSTGKRFYWIFKDGFSGFKAAYTMKHKSETPDCFKAFAERMYTDTRKRPRIFRSDGGGEFKSNSFVNWLSSQGILHQTSAAHTPQQNGVAERDNRTTVEAVRTALHAKQIPLHLWPAAVNYTIYTQNRILRDGFKSTPYEFWYGKKPNVSYLCAFGTRAFVHFPDADRRKLDPKAVEGLFVGYSETVKAYLVYVAKDRKVITSRDVKFMEEVTHVTNIDQPLLTEHKKIDQHNSTEQSFQPLPQPELRKSKRGLIPKKQWPSDSTGGEIQIKTYHSQAMEALDLLYKEPQSYKEAIASPHAEQWRNGMDKEIASLKENNTWTLVPAPRNSAVIPCRWQYKAKRDKEGNVVIFKARFVAKGFKQQHGIDYTETFAPVVRYDSLRSILALAASRDLHLLQIDVQTAFLYGEIDQELFIHQPEEYVTEDSENYVCRLNKGLYGLKQSSRLWNKKIHRSLVNLLFTQSEADPCVYTRLSGGDIMILAIWVDDGLFAFSDKSAGQSVIDHLREEYKMKAGPAEHFVGLNINRDRPNKTLHLSSPSYIEKVLAKFNMTECNPVRIPAEPSLRLSRDMEPADVETTAKMRSIPYRQVIGSLMYAAITFRPDITYAVNQLARFCENPGESHWSAAKKVLKYLASTRRFGLQFTGAGIDIDTLSAFSDADYAGDTDTRRSTSGFVFMFNQGAITWSSRRQNCVALSTMESEYIAASDSSREAVWLRRLTAQIGAVQKSPTNLYCDNKSAIAITHNPEHHSRSKHIDVKYHFLRDQQSNGTINISHISSESQLADIFTKPLSSNRFCILRSQLGVVEGPITGSRF